MVLLLVPLMKEVYRLFSQNHYRNDSLHEQKNLFNQNQPHPLTVSKKQNTFFTKSLIFER